MTTKYLILNETTFIGTDQISTEPVSLHSTLDGACGWLADLAEEHDVFIEDDANSIYIPPATGIETDEYYIVEMEEKY